jgi:hypothetical protein
VLDGGQQGIGLTEEADGRDEAGLLSALGADQPLMAVGTGFFHSLDIGRRQPFS